MSGGDLVDAADAECHVVEITTDQTMALRVHVSFLTSLFQWIGAEIRQLRRGGTAADTVPAALARFASVCPPIEIMRWGEYAVRGATSLAAVERAVKLRAEEWAVDLTETLESMAERYRGTWTLERPALLETQRWLATTLSGIKDPIVLGLRRSLALTNDDRPVEIVLVRQAYDIAGAHSHPVLIDTSRFSGTDLIETVFHEIGHELVDRSVGQESGITALNRALRARAPSRVNIYDLLHLLLFARTGSLVREHFDIAHRPLLYRDGRLSRMLQNMGVSPHTPDVAAALDGHAAGHIQTDELVQFFISHSTRSAPSGPE